MSRKSEQDRSCRGIAVVKEYRPSFQHNPKVCKIPVIGSTPEAPALGSGEGNSPEFREWERGGWADSDRFGVISSPTLASVDVCQGLRGEGVEQECDV